MNVQESMGDPGGLGRCMSSERSRRSMISRITWGLGCAVSPRGPWLRFMKSKSSARSGRSKHIKEVQEHTGSFAQNSFQIDLINSCITSKKLQFWLKIIKIICFLILKPIKGKLGFILKIMKKIARWRHKSKISKRNVKFMISPLLFRL